MASTNALAAKGLAVASTPSLEPTWHGYIANTTDAMVLLEATFDGTLSHLPRRPHDKERADLIKSGNVFIHEANSSGVKRWTDGVTWSPSRMVGNFLVYRELNAPFAPGEKKRATAKDKRQNPQKKRSGVNPNISSSHGPLSKEQERSLVGSLVDSYDFKEDRNCLIKKTITIKVKDLTHHIVSYYTIDDVISGKLRRPSEDPRFSHIRPRKEIVSSKSYKHPPDDVGGLSEDDDVREHPAYQGQSQNNFSFANPNAPRLPVPAMNNMAYHSNNYLTSNYAMGIGSTAYNLPSYGGHMPVTTGAGSFNSHHPGATPNTTSLYSSGIPAVAPHGNPSYGHFAQAHNMYNNIYRQPRHNSNTNMNATPPMHRVSNYGQQSLESGLPETAPGMSGMPGMLQGQMPSRNPHETVGSGMPGMFQGQMNNRDLNETNYSSPAVYQARDNAAGNSHGYSQPHRTLSAPSPSYNPHVAAQYNQHMEASPGNASAGHAHYMMHHSATWPHQQH